ncbi:hypothetical protein PF004_g5031 [Phytophthora fragariae]|uniref:TFIIS N-terminal domain-containing protein n=1 Tax=Phytophthora fragariae TaxID=53985 RepID=A0A6G0PGP2_9STRA|nr:hypothetical protein PF004_g5031 [Phytophthora fragariae]
MAHIETKDPFGFVGSHVVRKQPRKGGKEHGWLTRYDETLDCYTLFVPGGGEPRLLARGEVMKFLSAPNIELHSHDEDNFPPPVKDTTTSRYLGVKLRRPRQGSSEDDSHVDEDVRGRVTCFLPFGDRYCVEYEDGSTEEVSESAVIDGMIALIKSPFFSSPSRKKTRNGSIRTREGSDYSDDSEEVAPARRKRQRVEPVSDVSVESIPPEDVVTVENSADEQKEDDVVVADQTEPEFGISEETEPVPNILEIMSSAMGSATRENALEMASHPVEEPVQVDEGEVVDQGNGVEAVESREEPTVSSAPQTETGKEVPFYTIDKKPHEATEPLPKRAMAFELLRASLLNLLDRREATAVKMAMQYDLLRNTDVRDRDAVKRFMETDGLVVLNHLLNSYATDVLDDEDEESKESDVSESLEKIRDRMERDDELLHVMKIVAMLPTPARTDVIASNIGKTINYLSKTRGPPGRKSPLPKCIIGLAKWIKSSWIKNIPPVAKSSPKAATKTQSAPSRPQQQARRGGRGGLHGRPGRRQQPSQRPQREVSLAPRHPPGDQQVPIDNTPIPRLVRPPSQQPPAAAAASASLPLAAAPRRVTGGLKPDWMRQKENLSRSRFCIADNTNVDTRLYHDSRTRPITNVPVVASSSSQATTQPDRNSDQHEDAGGPDGVFGRPQRLRFRKRWRTQEFGIRDPPGILTQPPVPQYSIPSYGRSQYPDEYPVHVPPVPYSSRRPRSILRRVSRYNDEPAIEGS